jgi:hypothetical protein
MHQLFGTRRRALLTTAFTATLSFVSGVSLTIYASTPTGMNYRGHP